MNLAEIIAGLRVAGAEFEDVEAKRAAGGVPESLASTLAAFANARGESSSSGSTNSRGSRLPACRMQRRHGTPL
jgi:ATP-dependent DNA helicase RecG